MTALFIILGIIVFILLLLFLPISVFLSVKDDFKVIVRFSGIKVFDSSKPKKEKKEKTKPQDTENETQKEQKKENKLVNTFKNKKEESGIVGAVRYFGEIVKIILGKLVWFLKKLKFDHIRLNLSVSSEDAADTAIMYGTVCTALYPILSLITSNASVKYKEINISADFNKTAIILDLSFCVKLRLIYALVALIKGYFEYRKFIKEEDKNERK
ncbi:MAG: DUF2953 domain-containing protein [Clostridia bacterium]|nr:DUF2953 domain-containing protein [Clostridia bacterium]